jgi:uncharacterized membrane protein YccC
MPALDRRAATKHALLTAAATAICLVIALALGLEHANLAVWTTFMVLVQFPFSRFQKGLERVVGRGLGILAGLVLTTWFNDAFLLVVTLQIVLLVTFFYLFFAGRLAYTFLNAGLYLVAVFHIGHANPAAVVSVAKELFAAIVLGVVGATMVTWLVGAEHDLHIHTGEAPLLPIRSDWLSQSLMLAFTVLLTLLSAHLLGLPPDKAAISVLLLTVSPHMQALILKGELRIAGLVLATAWSLMTFLIVGVLPFLPLFVILLFLGVFTAAYLARIAGKYSYMGVQMGLVLPLVTVAPPTEFGSLTPVVQRLAGILLALAASILVASLWPRFPIRDEATALPLPHSTSR